MLNKLALPIIFVVFILSAFIFIQNNSVDNAVKEKKSINVDTAKCDVINQTCVVDTNEFRIIISFDENIYYLKPFNVSVISESLTNIKLESIQVDFKMKGMNMGVNRFMLKNTAYENNKSIWQGEALLPICVTGRADWFSKFEVMTKNNKYLISLPILVKKALN